VKYNRILRAVCATPWALQQDKLETLLAFLELKAAGGVVAPEVQQQIHINAVAVEAARKANGGIQDGSGGAVAVLPLYGLISHRANLMADISGPGGTSVERFASDFRAAVDDPRVSAIVIDVDSPGGTVDGVPELADLIMSARDKKPVTAIANAQMASAAYWLGAAAKELVVTPSGMVGSIGVFLVRPDVSKAMEMEGVKYTLVNYGEYKTEGHPSQPMTEAELGALQSMVDDYGEMFVRAVAKGRGVTIDTVKTSFGKGRMRTAKDAVAKGMADRVGTLDDVLAGYGVNRGSAGRAKAELATAVVAETPATDLEAEHHRKVEYERMRLEFA
jgi:signal peptide peptidase SppA